MDYINGKIYTIRNTVNNQLYVGSTTLALSQRMAQHRKDSKKDKKMNFKLYKAFEEHGADQFYIELVELFHCETKEHLRAREGFFIRQFDSYREGYNGKVSGRTSNEGFKERYALDEEYRLRIQENKAQYYQDNKFKISEYQKLYQKMYRQNNKVKIQESKKLYYKKTRNMSQSNSESIIVNLRETEGGVAFTIQLQ